MSDTPNRAATIAGMFFPLGSQKGRDLSRLIATAIDDATTREREKWIAAGFADEKGEPRKVLGTLPMTADGAYVGDDGNCFFPRRYGNRVVMMKKVRIKHNVRR